MIEHANIFYCKDISEIGGVETWIYELVKKFKDYDIAVVYKTGNIKQLRRIRKYCKTYKHDKQMINCKVALINYDTSIIDYICEEAKIYQGIHADYENPAYTIKPPTHPRITSYIAITKYIEESFKRITGKQNVIQLYNPLSIEKRKPLVLISATRLSRVKGKERMEKLGQALNKAKIDYIWYVFTNDKKEIDNENIIYTTPRIDLGYWFDHADYLVQLSDTEGLSYSINEMLYRNKPVIVTPLPYLDEIGVKDNVNAYIMEFDCSNIDDIVKKIKKIPKFEFKKLKDNYEKLIYKSKSHYEEDLKQIVKIRSKRSYKDIELGKHLPRGHEWSVYEERAQELLEKNLVEII